MALLLTEAAKLSNEVPRNPPLRGRRASDRESRGGAERCACHPVTLPCMAVAPATANKQTPLLSPVQLQKPRQKTITN